MFDIEDLQLLALNTPSHLAQRVIKSSCVIDYFLASNLNLSSEIWMEIWKENDLDHKLEDNPNLAAAMFYSASTLELKKLVLKAPPGVISEYLRNGAGSGVNHIPKEILDTLLDPVTYPSEEIAGSLIISGQVSLDQVLPLWNRVAEALHTPDQRVVEIEDDYYFEFLMDVLFAISERYPSMSDEKLVEMLELTAFGMYEVVKTLVDKRPSIAKAMLESKEAACFAEALAYSRHLREPLGSKIFQMATYNYSPNTDSASERMRFNGTLTNLAGNYAMPYELRLKAYEALAAQSSTHQGAYAGAIQSVRKALEHNVQPITTPWEELEGEEFEQLKTLQASYAFSDYPSLLGNPKFDPPTSEDLTAECVLSDLSPRLDQLGPNAWEIFISMLDGWNGDIEDLLAVAASTAKI